jgi:hypothetical protein
MRIAVPLASSFVVWLVGLGASVGALRYVWKRFRLSRFVWAGILICVAVIAAWFGAFGTYEPMASLPQQSALRSAKLVDAFNEPIGEAKGCNPGRVAWVHDPDATDWEGPSSGESCWEPENTDQVVVDSMVFRAIRWLAGEPTDAEAWETLFRYFNGERGKGDRGYQPGEKIAIKINLTACNAAGRTNPSTREKTKHLDKAADTSPQLILALLRQLVNVVSVEQSDISVGDPVAFFPEQWYEIMAPEFPNVHYLDHYPFPGRTQVQHSTIPFYWSTTAANGKEQDYLPVAFAEASYIINLAVLKSHNLAGITVCAKNHYGSLIRTPTGREWGSQGNYHILHESLPCDKPGRSYYRAMVDLMGHAELGGKTVLYIVDGLFGGQEWYGMPYKWNMPPFNGDWPSSLFASQDPVAIDSVAYDFLLAEWPDQVDDGDCGAGGLEGGAQDYLHEAAQANDPPSGTFYDPENDSMAMGSLGVHEHWNNSEDKQYSRNLGTGAGIELVSSIVPTVIDDGNLDDDRGGSGGGGG